MPQSKAYRCRRAGKKFARQNPFVAFSDDGKRLAQVSLLRGPTGSEVCVWDTTKETILWHKELAETTPFSTAFSPDGSTLILARRGDAEPNAAFFTLYDWAALTWPDRPVEPSEAGATGTDSGPTAGTVSGTVGGTASGTLGGISKVKAAGRGHQPGRKAGALVVLVDGQLVLYVERGGKSLLTWTESTDALQRAADALALAVREGALGRLTVERTDGSQVLGSGHPVADALAKAGFHATPRGLRLRR